MFKVNNRNTRTMSEICSKLTIKTPERRHWPTGKNVTSDHTSHGLVYQLFYAFIKINYTKSIKFTVSTNYQLVLSSITNIYLEAPILYVSDNCRMINSWVTDHKTT